MPMTSMETPARLKVYGGVTADRPETPGPVRARVSNLQSQVDELVRKSHNQDRRHQSELARFQVTVAEQKAELDRTTSTLSSVEKAFAKVQQELERCQAEGTGMREELQLASQVAQNKMLLALAQGQLQVVELEQKLVKAEAARVMRDHKISLLHAKEAELVAELAERNTRINELESTAVSQRSAESKSARSEVSKAQGELREAKEEITSLEGKVETLGAQVRTLREREKDARAELDSWLKDEKSREGSASKERKELRVALRKVEAELRDKDDQLAEAQRTIRALEKGQRAPAAPAALSLASVAQKAAPKKLPISRDSEDEIEQPKKTVAKPAKASQAADSDSDDFSAPKKTKKSESARSSKPSAPSEVDSNIVSTKAKQRGEAESLPEKKLVKKRKLGIAQSTFSFDSLMGGGDGVIPAFLSPAKPGGSTLGTIPRAGFGSMPSRSAGRFAL